MEQRKRPRKQSFIAAYKEKYPCMTRSTKGETYAFCKICRTDISIACGGSNDIKKHIEKKNTKTMPNRKEKQYLRMGK
jgi:hypothetical protein